MVHALDGFAVVLRFSPEDIRHKRLRVTVVQREPTRLDLHHHAVSRQEHMIGIWQGEAIDQWLAALNGLGILQAFAIAPAENIRRDHQLIASHPRLGGYFIWIYVNQFYNPV